jgi:hypothetical protein
MCCLLNQPKFNIGRTYPIGAFGRWSICGKQTIASFRNMVQRSNTITKTLLVAKMLAWGPLHWQGQLGCRQGVWVLRKVGFPSWVGGVGPWHPKPGTKLWSANGVLAEEYTVSLLFSKLLHLIRKDSLRVLVQTRPSSKFFDFRFPHAYERRCNDCPLETYTNILKNCEILYSNPSLNMCLACSCPNCTITASYSP